MKTFVLIPGAWLGAWVWEPVVAALQDRGHEVYPVTLTGLDRKIDDCSHISLATHVNDVLSILHGRDLRDVIVVGHGTSGVIAGAVADRAADRVVHTVYVDAFLPHDGQSVLDAFGAPVRAHELRVIADSGGHWPVPDAEAVGEGQDLTPEQTEWLVTHMVDHPGGPLTEPVTLTGSPDSGPATFVVCELDHPCGRLADDIERLRTAPGWTFVTLETGVWPMVSTPGELARVLDGVAGEAGDGPASTSGCGPSPVRDLRLC